MTMKLFLLVLSLAVLTLSCASMQAKKPVFKNTRWVCVQQTFVADAGTATDTYTIDFISDKECLWKSKWVLPSHPAMYMNADGTVDTIPGSSSETVSRATWSYSRKSQKLTLQFEDGSTTVLQYRDGHLTTPARIPYGDEMIFSLLPADPAPEK